MALGPPAGGSRGRGMIPFCLIILLASDLPAPAEWPAGDELAALERKLPVLYWEGGWDLRDEFEMFIRDHPGETDMAARARAHMGEYYYSVNDSPRALEIFQSVALQFPGTSGARLALLRIADLYRYQMEGDHVAAYERVARDFPGTREAGEAIWKLARHFLAAGQSDTAARLFTEVIDTYPLNHFEVAWSHMELGNLAGSGDALPHYSRGLGVSTTEDYIFREIIARVVDVSYDDEAFLSHQLYGPAGPDGIRCTDDDMDTPEIASPRPMDWMESQMRAAPDDALRRDIEARLLRLKFFLAFNLGDEERIRLYETRLGSIYYDRMASSELSKGERVTALKDFMALKLRQFRTGLLQDKVALPESDPAAVEDVRMWIRRLMDVYDGDPVYDLLLGMESSLDPRSEYPASQARPVQDGKIDINSASLDDLTRLPGIDEYRAKMIDAYRYTYGPFETIDDLKRVPDITPEIYGRIKDHVRIEP